MLKIAGIGLGKTGTTSLATALGLLGYRTVHDPQSFRDIRGCVATVGSPVAYWFRNGVLPECEKYILTVRNVDDWVASYKSHLKSTKLTQIGSPMFYQVRSYFFNLSDGEDVLRDAYYKHLSFCRNSGLPILELDICGGEGWRKLCDFLGRSDFISSKQEPPFPWRNQSVNKSL